MDILGNLQWQRMKDDQGIALSLRPWGQIEIFILHKRYKPFFVAIDLSPDSTNGLSLSSLTGQVKVRGLQWPTNLLILILLRRIRLQSRRYLPSLELGLYVQLHQRHHRLSDPRNPLPHRVHCAASHTCWRRYSKRAQQDNFEGEPDQSCIGSKCRNRTDSRGTPKCKSRRWDSWTRRRHLSGVAAGYCCRWSIALPPVHPRGVTVGKGVRGHKWGQSRVTFSFRYFALGPR